MATEMDVGEEQQVVNPWEVSVGKGGIDYDKLVDQFGCQRIDAALVARLTGRPPRPLLRPPGLERITRPVREGGEVLPVHGEGALVGVAALRPPHPLHVHQIFAGRVQSASSYTAY
jgi:hypothetical protein